MHFSKFKLENYKSIYSSGDLSFTPGFNVIVGRNDVGKTTLVEGLSLAFGNIAHRSEKTIPYRGVPSSCEARAFCTIHLPGDEMRDMLLGQSEFYVPLLANSDEVASVKCFDELLNNGADLTFRSEAGTLHDVQLPQYQYFADTANPAALIYRPQSASTRILGSPDGTTNVSTRSTFGYLLANLIRSRIYTFKAERPTIGEAPIGPGSDLAISFAVWDRLPSLSLLEFLDHRVFFATPCSR